MSKSDWRLWRDILLSNNKNTVSAVKKAVRNIENLIRAVESEDKSLLSKQLKKIAGKARK